MVECDYSSPIAKNISTSGLKVPVSLTALLSREYRVINSITLQKGPSVMVLGLNVVPASIETTLANSLKLKAKGVEDIRSLPVYTVM
ncbi:hypothetical protein V496_09945 [Pseudogymnoascus sp. VKM F-4515 (FW-2607)]|nr:hypothetical protein V496_09945 [Pseudogymnoascus sp. VKM F-4515 (FW-2607)]